MNTDIARCEAEIAAAQSALAESPDDCGLWLWLSDWFAELEILEGRMTWD